MEQQTSVTDFTDISSFNFNNWTNDAISNLDRILTALGTRDPRALKLLELKQKFEEHVADGAAHGFNIPRYGEELIQGLYYIYRGLGYTGTIGDMLRVIEKKIEIASLEDVKVGMSTTKAINTKGWHYLFQEHIDNPLAHIHLYKAFNPDNWFTDDVVFTLSELNKFLWEKQQEYTPSYFNPHQGTLVFVFNYGQPDELMSFIDVDKQEHKLKIESQNENLVLLLDRQRLIRLPTDYQGVTRIAISLRKRKLMVRSVLTTTTVVDNSLPKISKLRILSDQVKEFVYYVNSANSAELTFLVN